MSAPNKVPKEVTTERDRRAWELRQKGWTTRHIAEELTVDHSTICRALSRVETRLAKQFEQDALRIKARHTAQLEHIADEAMQAWERSKLDAEMERVTDKDVTLDGGMEGTKVMLPATETTTVHEKRGQAGNPSFLSEARAAQADIRSIWGLDAPKKTDVTSDGQPVKALIGVDLDKI